jgi:hypothetical protein
MEKFALMYGKEDKILSRRIRRIQRKAPRPYFILSFLTDHGCRFDSVPKHSPYTK